MWTARWGQATGRGTTTRRPQTAAPTWPARAATLLAAALLTLACGGDATDGQDEDAADDMAADNVTAEETQQQDDDAAEQAEAEDVDQGEGSPDPDAPPAIERAIDSTLTGEDGWSDPLDLEIPDAGTAVLEFDGRNFTFDVSCFGTGEIPDTVMDGNRRLNEFLLFNFVIRGSGQADDGRNVRIDASRGIFVAGDRALQIRDRQWGGEGQLDRIVFSGLGEASSLVQSPSSGDPDGARLPVVWVTPDGVVTAEGELVREFADDTDAPEGPFTFAGRCQEPWPQDELDAAGG